MSFLSGGTFAFDEAYSTIDSNSSSSFDWSSLLSFGSGGTDGLVNNLTSGLDMATGGLFSQVNSAVSSLIGFDITGNLQTAASYGWDSWGASSTPESEEAFIKINMDKVNSLVAGMSLENLQDSINRIEYLSSWLVNYFKASLNRRTWAGSTTKAFEGHRDRFMGFRKDVLDPIIKGLKNNGSSVSYREVDEPFEINKPKVMSWVTPSSNDTAEKNTKYNLSKYSVNGSRYKVYTITLPKTIDVLGIDSDSKGDNPPKEGSNFMPYVYIAIITKWLKIW